MVEFERKKIVKGRSKIEKFHGIGFEQRKIIYQPPRQATPATPPLEGNLPLMKNLQPFLDKLIDFKLPLETLLFALAINQLKNAGLIETSFTGQKITRKIASKPAVYKLLSAWQKEMMLKPPGELFSIKLPKGLDLLGQVYQYFTMRSQKLKQGAYYTPENLAKKMVSRVKASETLLDPCCGSGQFLLAAAKKIKDPNQLYGMDNDPIAVKIATINLLLAYPHHDFTPQIFCVDALKNKLLPTGFFDNIVTNPPWGAHYSARELAGLSQCYPTVSQDSFAFFTARCMAFLKPEGKLSILLPEAMLNIKKHEALRYYLLTEVRLERIDLLPAVFKKVLTKVVRLDIQKASPIKTITVFLDKVCQEKITRVHFLSQSHYTLTIGMSAIDQKIIEKIKAVSHTTLKNQAIFALGIVTGNNKKYLKKNPGKNRVAVYKGKDILPFHFKTPSHYVENKMSDFQQVAPLKIYEAPEKLLYRFISKKLIFAYDDKQRLPLNSVNVLIPKIPHYPMKVIAALFNSRLYQWLFEKQFFSVKILRAQLEALPLPLWDKAVFRKIEVLANKIESEPLEKKYQETLDKLIMEGFGLSEEERKYLGS